MALNRAQKEVLKGQLKSSTEQDVLALEKVHVEEKNRYGNIRRLINTNRIDEGILNEWGEGQQKLRNEHLRKEENLALEMSKLKTEEMREMKMRQLLRENCHELKELETKLKTAYVSKQLAAQRAELEANKLRIKIEEKRAYQAIQDSLIQEEEYARQLAQDEINKKAQYKRELQDQMILKEKTKRFMYEEFLQEKKMLDDIIQRLHEENERELQEKWCRMQKTKEEMMAFRAAQQMWKQKEMRELDEEHKRIQAYILSKTTDTTARKQAKEEREAVKAKISEDIAKKIALQRAMKKERDDLVQELLEEEQREAMDKKHKEEVETEIRKRLDIRESLHAQMEERREKLRKEAEDDANYKQQILTQLAEDEKLQQLSREKRRLKMMQYKKDIDDMMTEKRKKRVEEIQFITRLIEEDEKEHIEKRRLIEEERIRMLREHAKNLIGYIPRGVLREDDLPHLGSEFLEKYKGHRD